MERIRYTSGQLQAVNDARRLAAASSQFRMFYYFQKSWHFKSRRKNEEGQEEGRQTSIPA